MKTDAGFSDPLVSDTPLPFRTLCARIHGRIATFLDAQDVPDRVKSVQEQTRVSLDVIGEALDRYRWVVIMWRTEANLGLTSMVVCHNSLWRITAGRIVWSSLYFTFVLYMTAASPIPPTLPPTPRLPYNAYISKMHTRSQKWRILSREALQYTRWPC